MAEEKTITVITETITVEEGGNLFLDDSYLIATDDNFGVIINSYGSLTVDGTTFEGNECAITTEPHIYSCTVSNAKFYDNESAIWREYSAAGGDLTVTNSEFVGRNDKTSYGIYCEFNTESKNSKIIIEDSSFSNFKLPHNYGIISYYVDMPRGAQPPGPDSEFILKNCTFSDCQTTTNGLYAGYSIIKLEYAPSAFVEGCSFTNITTPSSTSLGAVFYVDSTTLTVSDSIYTDCFSRVNGGAFYICDSSNVTVNNISVTDCHAAQSGSIAYVLDSVLTINNSVFTNTDYYTSVSGGAIYAENATVTVKNSVFEKYAAQQGGAIYAAENTSLSLENCVFTEATDSIYLSNSNLELSGTNYFSSDILAADGSTITVVNGTVGFMPHHQDSSSSEIFDVSKLEYTPGIVKSYAVEAGNISSDGTYYLAKNIAPAGYVTLYVDGINVGSLDFYNRQSQTFYYDKWSYTLSLSDISGTSTLSVSRLETDCNGSFTVKAGETVCFDSSDVFRDLTSDDSDTYAAITNNGTLYVDGSQFLNNSISGVRNYGTAEIKNADFEGHSYFAAIRQAKGTLTVDNTTFTNNTSGAVYVDNGSAYISNSTFSGNSYKDGGALYVRENTNTQVTLKDNFFTTASDTICLADGAVMTLEGTNYFAGSITGNYRAVNVYEDCVFGFYLNNYAALDEAYIDGYVICPQDRSFTVSVSMDSAQRGTYVFAENFNANYLGFEVTQIDLVVDGVDSGELIANAEALRVGYVLYSFANDKGTLSVTVSGVTFSNEILLNSTYSENNVPEGYEFGYDAFSTPDAAVAAAQETNTKLMITGGTFDTAIHFNGVETEMNAGFFSGDLYADGGKFTVSGGTQDTVLYGGSVEGTSVEESSITINGGTLRMVYGGGDINSNTGISTITMTNGYARGIYGGSNTGGKVETTHVVISGGQTAEYVFGGGITRSTTGNANLTIKGGKHYNIYGGADGGKITGDINLTVSGGTMNYIHGAGYTDTVKGNITITVTGGSAHTLFAAGAGSEVAGTITVNISGGSFSNGVYGGNRSNIEDGSIESVLNLSGNYTFTADTVIENFDKINFTVDANLGAEKQDYYLISSGNFNLENTCVTINGVSANEYGIYTFGEDGKYYAYQLINTGSEIALASNENSVILCQNGEIVDSADNISHVELEGSGTYRSMFVLSSGVASDITVNDDGILFAGADGIVSEVTANANSQIILNKGFITYLILNADSTLTAVSGGTLENLFIDDEAVVNIATGGLNEFSGNTSQGRFELVDNTLSNFFITQGSTFTVNSENFAFAGTLSVAGTLALEQATGFNGTALELDLNSGNEKPLLSGWANAAGSYTITMRLDLEEAAQIGVYTLADSKVEAAELVINNISLGSFSNGEKRVIDHKDGSLNYRFYTDEKSGETALYIYDLARQVTFPDIWQEAPTELQVLDHSAVLSDEKVYFEIENGVGALISGPSVATVCGAGDTDVEQDVYLYVESSVFTVTGGGKTANTAGDIYIYAAPGVTVGTVVLGGETGTHTGNAHLYICNSTVNTVKRGNLDGTAQVTIDSKNFTGAVENIDRLELVNNSSWKISETSVLNNDMSVVISLDNRTLSSEAIVYSGTRLSFNGTLDIVPGADPADGKWHLASNIDLAATQITVDGNRFTGDTLFYNGVLYTLEQQETADLYLNVENKWITPDFPDSWENMPDRLSDISFADSNFIADSDISYTLSDGIGGALKKVTITETLYAGFEGTDHYRGNTYLYLSDVETQSTSAGADGVSGTEDDITIAADIYGSGNETRTGDIYIAIDGGSYNNIYGAGTGGVTGSLAVNITNNATVSGVISAGNVSGDRLLRFERLQYSYKADGFTSFEIVDAMIDLTVTGTDAADVSITVSDLSNFNVAPALTVRGGLAVSNLTLNLDFDSSTVGDWVIASGVDLSNTLSITVNGENYTLGDTIFNLQSGNDLTITKNDQNELVLSSVKDERLYIILDNDDNHLVKHERFRVEENLYYGVINSANSDIDAEIFYLGDPENIFAKVQLDIEEDSKLRYTTFDTNNCAEVSITAENTSFVGIKGAAAGSIDLNNVTLLGAVNTANADVTISGAETILLDGITANDLTLADGLIVCAKQQITAENMDFTGGTVYGNINVSDDFSISGGTLHGNLKTDGLVIKGGTISGNVSAGDYIELRGGSCDTYSGIKNFSADTVKLYAGIPAIYGHWEVGRIYVYDDAELYFYGGSSFKAKSYHIEEGTSSMYFNNANAFDVETIIIEEGCVWNLNVENNSNITLYEIERKVDFLGNDGIINIAVTGGSKLTFDDWSISSNDTDFSTLTIDSDSEVTFERKIKLDLGAGNKSVKNEGKLIFNGNVEIGCISENGDKEVELTEKGAETYFNADSEINGDMIVRGTITVNDELRIGDFSDISNILNFFGTTDVETTKDSKIIINKKGDFILGTDLSLIGDAWDWSDIILDRRNELNQKGEMYIYEGGQFTTRGEWHLDNTTGDEAIVYNYGKVLLTTFQSIHLSGLINALSFSSKAFSSSLIIDKQCEFYNYGDMTVESHNEAGILMAIDGDYMSFDLSDIEVKGTFYNAETASIDLFGKLEVKGTFYNYGTIDFEQSKDSQFFINDGEFINYGYVCMPNGLMAENETFTIKDRAGLHLNDARLVNYGTMEFDFGYSLLNLLNPEANVSVTGIDKDCEIENYGTLSFNVQDYVELQGKLYNKGEMTIGTRQRFVDFDAQKLSIHNDTGGTLDMYIEADSEIDSKSTIKNDGILYIEVEDTKNFYLSTKDEEGDYVILNNSSAEFYFIGNLYFDSDGRNKLKNDVFLNYGTFVLENGKIQLDGDAAEKGDFDYFVTNYGSFTFYQCSAPTLIYGGGMKNDGGEVIFYSTTADMSQTLAGNGSVMLINSTITLEGGDNLITDATLSSKSHLTIHNMTGNRTVDTGSAGSINVLELSGVNHIKNTGNGALILNTTSVNASLTAVKLTDIALFSEVTINVEGALKSDYTDSKVLLARQERCFDPDQTFSVNFEQETAKFIIGQGQYLSCGQYVTLNSVKDENGYLLDLTDENYMLDDGSAVRFAYGMNELFVDFYALSISDLSKVDFVMYVGSEDLTSETITALGYDEYYSRQAADLTGKIIVENSSVGTISFSDAALELKDAAAVSQITGNAKDDSILISGTDVSVANLDLAEGANTITVTGNVSELGLQLNGSGSVTVAFEAGSSFADALITLAADAAAKKLSLDWSGLGYQEVRILVDDSNNFDNSDYIFEIRNGAENFTFDCSTSLYYRVDALVNDEWITHVLPDETAPEQVAGLHFDGTNFVWDEARDDWGGNGVSSYIIEIASDENFADILETQTSTERVYNYLLPEDVTSVFARVKAVDFDGNEGVWSETVPNIVDSTPPEVPTGLTAETDHKNVVFAWDETTDDMTGVKEYTVTYSSANESYSVTLKDTSLALEDLTPGNWTWSVQAVDNAGNISDAAQGEVFVINPFEFAVIGNPLQWVNTDIILTAAAEPGQSLKFAYSFDNTEWIESSVAVISENTTVYFRGENALGETVTYSITVDRIDKTAPDAPTVTADITCVTNQDVTLSATLDDASAVLEYSVDNENWLAYTDGVVMPVNGTVYFRSKDQAGNCSDTVSYDVTNIDKTAPALEISSNTADWTNNDVVLTAIASEGTIEYFDGSAWVEGNTLTVSENGTYLFRVTDEAGNVTEKSVDVTLIDKAAPALKISGNATQWTNQDVTLTASADEEAAVEYSFDGVEWFKGTEVTVSENKTVSFKAVDRAGNVTETSVVVDKIDKVAPTLEISGNATQWTNEDVILTADTSDSNVVFYNGSAWVAGAEQTVSANGTYLFRVTDEAGNVTEKSVTVDKIDKNAPRLMVIGNAEEVTNDDVVLTVISEDLESSISKIEYSFNGIQWVEGSEVTVSENGTVCFKATDAAGNISETSVVVDKIDKVPPTLEISGNPTSWTNEDVVLTATVSSGSVVFYNGTEWVAGAEHTVSANGTYIFRVTDEAGNMTEKSVTVDKIDKDAPVLELSGIPTEWTNQDVFITAAATDAAGNGATVMYKKLTDTEFTLYPGAVSENGTYIFYAVDNLGNESALQTVAVDKIDKNVPRLLVTGNAEEATNKDVILTAIFDDLESSVSKVEYSFNGIEWVEGTKVTVSENGTVHFKATDAAGNFTETSVVVDKIDKVAPELEITGNATQWTNEDVTLTASASDGTIEYFDGVNWITGNSITATENGTYFFRVTDEAGNVTEKSVDVTFIDKAAPMLEISGNAAGWTNQDVTLTASADEEITVEYSFDESEWFEGTEVTVSENKTVYFKAVDRAGNVTETSVVVDKIDKIAPTLEITGNAAEWTNQDVILTASANEIVIVEYSFDGVEWFAGPEATVTENATVYFKAADRAGNTVEETVIVDKIDKVAPALEVTGNATEWTNKDVVLTASSDEGTIEYFNGSEWVEGSQITVTENGIFQFRVADAVGNVAIQTVVVDKIDKTAPVLEINGNAVEWTNKDVVLTVSANEEVTVEYSFDENEWFAGSEVTVSENTTVYFKAADLAGNVTTQTAVVDKIDKVAPAVSVFSDVTAWTKNSVILFALATEEATVEYSFDRTEWFTGSDVTVTENMTVYFRGTDTAGNVSEEVEYIVSNIDKLSPETPEEFSEIVNGSSVTLDWNDAADEGNSGIKGYYVRYGNDADLSGKGEFVAVSSLELSGLDDGSFYYQVRSTDKAGNYSEWSDVRTFDILSNVVQILQSDDNGLSWSAIDGAEGYTVEYSADNFETVFAVTVEGTAVDMISHPSSALDVRVSISGKDTWTSGNTVSGSEETASTRFVSDADGGMDLFFAKASGTWGSTYAAEHQGNGTWEGTKEQVLLAGKNRLADVFTGSEDANVLVLTDDANGDALFVDDIYTALGDQARFSQIDEIRAGAGDDIVDITSERYAYEGDGITIYGGSGNDTIWANKGNNTLFGDAGNDRLVGGSDDDVIAGGSGDDSLHGGGGDDIFTFGANWGNDTVEQLSSGSVTLWFETGSESNWNADTMTYSDGTGSVTVTGVSEVTLKFGADATLPEGAFSNESSEKIFEDNNKGFIA